MTEKKNADIMAFVDWDSRTAVAIAAQLQDRVRVAIGRGDDVAVLSVLVVRDSKTGLRSYKTGFSTCSGEILCYAAQHLKDQVMETQSDG